MFKHPLWKKSEMLRANKLHEVPPNLGEDSTGGEGAGNDPHLNCQSPSPLKDLTGKCGRRRIGITNNDGQL
ncbi:hypothetical protein PoB_005671600 [Plakobranchus ocellatus]|uniref:Uncharacterized protein n=1 Tax=Plakobranchus ocellatus TaxID=259542 RepID=A0AAV4CFQ8_9GAST|nr:hypothetical protein PoB_005671600 [Plakobranchus ocellatus]